jgi:biotin-dependent carboxylase-like uncharacterized protein
MNQLVVEKSTPFCTVQDNGRFGVRHLGVTQGGAVDWVSMYSANWLLGNNLTAPVIEVALGGFTLRSVQACKVAICGADMSASINGVLITPPAVVELNAGDRLVLSHPVKGQRAYIAVPGGFDVIRVLDSVSTVTREHLGGVQGDGRSLKANDVLEFSSATANARHAAFNPLPCNRTDPLELIVGAQLGGFGGQSTFDVFNAEWKLDARADRMGVRLIGPTLRYCSKGLVSEAIPLGAVQVPPDGQPIILLNDRQTIGGYPRLGAITPLSIARLAQMQPGDSLRFRAVTQDHAARQHLEFLRRYLA